MKQKLMKKVPISIITFLLFLAPLALMAQAPVEHTATPRSLRKSPNITAKGIDLFPSSASLEYEEDKFEFTPVYPRLEEGVNLSLSLSNMGLENTALSLENKDRLRGFIREYDLKNRKRLEEVNYVASSKLDLVTSVLKKYGVPADLKYLAVIESGMHNQARSHMGAVGPWQFMPTTARLLGLTVNAKQDDRKDLYKSTVAAAKYLIQLHKIFGNWELTIAAYNSGPVKVKDAIASTGSSNFWDLKNLLPKESQLHVMKFIATRYIMDRFSKLFGIGDDQDFRISTKQDGFSLSENTPPLAEAGISGSYSLPVIAKFISMDLADLLLMNPQLKEKGGKGDVLKLYLPADKMILFKDHQSEILNESQKLFALND